MSAARQLAYTVLNDIFINVNEQLRFAETKNGAIVTVDLAIVLAMLSTLVEHGAPLALHFENWLLSLVVCLGGAALIALASFLPSLTPRAGPTKQVVEPTNVFFFGHIHAWDEEQYVRRVFDGLGLAINPVPAHLFLANQIASNAKTANRKFVLFSIAATSTLVSIFVSTTFLLVDLLV